MVGGLFRPTLLQEDYIDRKPQQAYKRLKILSEVNSEIFCIK